VTRRVLPVVLWLVACQGGNAPGPAAQPDAAASAEVPLLVPLVEPGALRAAIAAGVRPRGANEASFEVDAFVAALVVEELAAGGGGLRVAPAVEGGAQVGYRVEAVADGSPYARVGLQAGDVIEAIGGVRLDSPGRAVGLLATSGRGATIAVVRDGVGFSIEVRVAGGLAWDALLRQRGGGEARLAVVSGGQVPEDRSRPVPEEPPAPEPWDRSPPTTGTGKPARPSGGSGGGTWGGGGSSGGGGGAGSGGGGAGSGGSAVAQCATAASCTIDRKAFDAAVADPDSLSRQVAIAPAKGGYKLTRVAPGSPIAQLGFRAGDTLISVNGSRLDDDLAALGLYAGLGSTSRYSVVYERNGVRATKAIALR
jgi:membrane-associated protease RseP (regulator of RpoE activity)